MQRRHAAWILILTLLFFAGSCDDFSLMEQFYGETKPPAPKKFELEGNTTKSDIEITLSWSYDNPEQISGFIIEHRTDKTQFEEVAELSRDKRSYKATGLNKNDNHYYRMYAFAGEKESLPTDTKSYTAP